MTSASKVARTISQQCFMVRSRAISRMMTQMYDDALRPFSIKAPQMNLVVAIGATGQVSPADLGKHLAMEKSTVSRNLEALKKRGWIATQASPEGRGQLVSLTASGQRLLLDIEPAWKAVQTDVEARLGPAALHSLDAMRHALKAP